MDIKLIRALVGPVTAEQLASVDCFTGAQMGLFIPAVGQCEYAVSREHTHPAFSFILTFHELQVGTKNRSQDHTETPALLGMSPDFPHHEESAEDFVRYYALMISADLYEKVCRTCSVSYPPRYHFTRAPGLYDLLPLLRGFMAATEDRRRITSRIEALELLITHAVVDAFHPPAGVPARLASHRAEIDHALEFIHNRFGMSLTVADIAREACLSASHLSALFRADTGYTVMGYLTRVRLEAGRRLLRDHDLPISEVAARCGFSSHSHFSRACRKAWNMTPKKLRRHS
ncbi:MAG: helix-turn-helix transcriptional regulator [Fibrobacterota bacterium]